MSHDWVFYAVSHGHFEMVNENKGVLVMSSFKISLKDTYFQCFQYFNMIHGGASGGTYLPIHRLRNNGGRGVHCQAI